MPRLTHHSMCRLLGSAFFILLFMAQAAHPASEPSREKTSPLSDIQLIPVIRGYPAGQVTPFFLLLKAVEGQKLSFPTQDHPLKIALEEDEIQVMGGSIFSAGQKERAEEIAVLRVDVRVAAETKPGNRVVRGVLILPVKDKEPVLVPFQVPLDILPAGEKPAVMSPEMLAKLSGLAGEPAAPPAQASGGASAASPFAGSSFWWTLLWAFLWGLGLNLTPCVYPLIPITVSFFGGRAQGSKALLLANALLYWAGLSLTYTALGAFASLGGGMLGQALTHPLVTLLIAAVLLAMALAMFGLWEIRLPARLGRLAGANRAGLWGTLIMGLTVGILAAPCVGPVVLGLMTHVAQVGRLDYGLVVFFSLSLGLGLPLTLLALFSGMVTRLPGAGDWMVWVRCFFGVVLVLMALYVAEPLIGSDLLRWAMALTGLAGGLFLGLIAKGGGKRFTIFKRFFGAAFALAAVGFFLYTAPPKPTGQITWIPYSPKVMTEAAAQGRPAVVYFTADWCLPCKELKARTFPDQRVIEAMKNFVPVMVDLTKGAPAEAQPLVKSLQIRGVPTIAFFDRKGRLLNDLTIVGLVGPKDLADRLKTALARAGDAGKGR